jgi:hypothetical protein
MIADLIINLLLAGFALFCVFAFVAELVHGAPRVGAATGAWSTGLIRLVLAIATRRGSPSLHTILDNKQS